MEFLYTDKTFIYVQMEGVGLVVLEFGLNIVYTEIDTLIALTCKIFENHDEKQNKK